MKYDNFISLFWAELFVVLALLVVTGCATNQLRITEYSGAALPVPGMNAAAGGCLVSQEGTVTGRLIYQGEKCAFDSQPEVTPSNP